MNDVTQAKSSLSCTWQEAEDRQLLDGLSATTAQKVAWFEEMIAIAWEVGALTAEQIVTVDKTSGK